MRTTQISDCNIVSGSCTSVTKGKIFKTQLFGQMRLHLNLMAQLIGIIVCTGLTKTPNIVEEKTVNLPGVVVWCVLSSRGLIGPYFFEVQMLEIMIPRLTDPFENENEVYFQQDGVPPYFHREIFLHSIRDG